MNLDKVIISGAVILIFLTLASLILGSIYRLPVLLETGRFLMWTSLGLSLIPLLVVIVYGIYSRIANREDGR